MQDGASSHLGCPHIWLGGAQDRGARASRGGPHCILMGNTTSLPLLAHIVPPPSSALRCLERPFGFLEPARGHQLRTSRVGSALYLNITLLSRRPVCRLAGMIRTPETRGRVERKAETAVVTSRVSQHRQERKGAHPQASGLYKGVLRGGSQG